MMWNHADCIMKKAKQIKSTDDVEGLELLRWEDQKEIRNYVQSGGPPDRTTTTATTRSKVSSGIEVSPTSRATCKSCSQKILKAEVRISTKPEGQGRRGLAWHHANCFMELSPSTEVEKLPGWETLPVADQAAVGALVKKVPSNARGKKTEEQEDKEFLQQSTSNTGTKRTKDSDGDQKSKVARSEEDASASRDVSVRDATDLESKLEAQTKELWALKDDLKKHATTSCVKCLKRMFEIQQDQGLICVSAVLME